MKSYTQMTEAERKELIRKAFEAKQKLQEEPEATKKEMKQKDKELNRLQEEVMSHLITFTNFNFLFYFKGGDEPFDYKHILCIQWIRNCTCTCILALTL